MLKFLVWIYVVVLMTLVNVGGGRAALSPAPLRPPLFALDNGTKSATASAGAATLNKSAGTITTEALTTATGAYYTLTVTNSDVGPADQVFASVAYGTATAGSPVIVTVTPKAGSFVVVIRNPDTAAFNGTLKVSFAVFKN